MTFHFSSREIPFVDREEVLASLLEVTQQEEGHCHVILGPSGMGKSRVLRRFVELVETQESLAPQRLCVYYDLSAVSPLLMTYARLEAQIAAHPVISRLTEAGGLEAWQPSLIRWMRKIVAAADPIAGPAVEDLDLEELAIRLLRTESTHSPYDVFEHFLETLLFVSRILRPDQRLILVLDSHDDAGWMAADPTRVHVLLSIVRNLPNRILILIALQGPASPTLFGGLLQQANVISFDELRSFQVADVRHLLEVVFRCPVSSSEAHVITRRYGGDPATLGLAIEFVRRQAADPVRRLAEEVPSNIVELVRLNYEGIDSSLDRLLLRCLAVALEPVPPDFLVEVAVPGEPPEVIERALVRPDAPRMVERSTGPRGERYKIGQLLWVEFLRGKAGTYGELADFDRRAGIYYEARKRPFLALDHYARAGDLEGIRRNLDEGLEWHRLHGETLRIQELYRTLVDLPLASRERFLLSKSRGWAWSQQGEAEEVLHQVESLLQECAAESVDRAELLVLRGDAFHNSSRYQEAYDDFCGARDLLERQGLAGSLLHRQARLEAAHIEVHLGAFARSESNHHDLWQQQRSLAGAEDRRTRIQSAREIRRYGELLVFTGDWRRARQFLESALEFFRDLEDRKGQGNALRRLADLDILAGDPRSLRRAIREAEQAKELLTEIGGRGAGWMDLVLGEAYRGLARIPEALEAHGRAWSRYQDGESPHLAAMAELGLAECERNPPGTTVLDPYERAVAGYERRGFSWGLGTALIYRALAKLSNGDHESGNLDLQRAEGVFESMDLRPPLATIRRIRNDGDLGFHPIIVL